MQHEYNYIYLFYAIHMTTKEIQKIFFMSGESKSDDTYLSFFIFRLSNR